MEDPETFESGLSEEEMDRVLEDIDFSDVLARGSVAEGESDADDLAGQAEVEPSLTDPSDSDAKATPDGAAHGPRQGANTRWRAPIVCEASGLPHAPGSDLETLTVRGRKHVALIAESSDEVVDVLGVLAGLVPITEGELHVYGRALHELGADALAEARASLIGAVVDGLPLIESLSVEENLRVAMIGAGVEAGRVDGRLAELIETLQLGDAVTRHPRELDTDALWRVRVARALAHEPSLCVVDVTSRRLDASMRAAIVERIGALVDGTHTTVVVACPLSAVPSWVEVPISVTPPPPPEEPAFELELED